MTETIIGIVGAVFGSIVTLLVSEYIRKKNRIEEYAKEMFSARVKIYEDLLSRIYNVRKIEAEISKSEDMSLEDKTAIWSEITLIMARYFDSNENQPIQVTEALNVHIMAMLLGFYSVFETDDKVQQEKIRNKFMEDILNAIEMIRNEAGFTKIENHYSELIKAKHNSEYVEVLRKLRKKYKK